MPRENLFMLFQHIKMSNSKQQHFSVGRLAVQQSLLSVCMFGEASMPRENLFMLFQNIKMSKIEIKTFTPTICLRGLWPASNS